MSTQDAAFTLEVGDTDARCPVGEEVAARNLAEGKTPVISCEGACIGGEIARQAANMVAREEPYRRACHGELFSVPGSAMTEWANESDRVVLIDGCFLRCHGRIMENLIDEDSLVQFDALSMYKKHNDVFGIDDVPEEERMEASRLVADRVLGMLAEAR